MLKHIQTRIVSMPGGRFLVEARNTKSGDSENSTWNPISPRLPSSAMAESFHNGFLNQDSDIGRRRLVFLECLARKAIEQNVEHLFSYVRDLMYYAYRCPVADSMIVDIQLPSQMDDMGDEYSDCVYELRKELFDKDEYSRDVFSMQYSRLDGQPMTDWPGSGIVDSEFPPHRQYLNVGSNYKEPLLLRWKVDLGRIRPELLK